MGVEPHHPERRAATLQGIRAGAVFRLDFVEIAHADVGDVGPSPGARAARPSRPVLRKPSRPRGGRDRASRPRGTSGRSTASGRCARGRKARARPDKRPRSRDHGRIGRVLGNDRPPAGVEGAERPHRLGKKVETRATRHADGHVVGNWLRRDRLSQTVTRPHRTAASLPNASGVSKADHSQPPERSDGRIDFPEIAPTLRQRRDRSLRPALKSA